MAAIPRLPVPAWLPAWQVGIVLSILVSLAVVAWLDRSLDLGSRRRARLLLGVPWGTLVSIGLVLVVYLGVQGGLRHFGAPVTVAFRSWSYLYPLGMLVAPFAHGGPGHLVGNLAGTVVLGTLAEYAWGHYPETRGAATFSSAGTNPYVRAFVLFPAGVAVVGFLTALFGWGPIIGFSGVVFAFAGFALVRYPLLTVVALAADDVVRVVYRGLSDPAVIQRAEPTFAEPWWAGIAVQGHLLGLFLGLVLGALLLRRRERAPAIRLWGGTLIVATSLSLWALWWYRGNAEYVLYRGAGVIFVVAIALAVTLSLRAQVSDRTLLSVPRRQVGLALLLLPVLVVGMVAVPLNLSTVADDGPPGDGTAIEVRDYTVAYAENVTNEMTSVVNVSVLGETTAVRTSGVIVTSDRRHLWTTAVTTSRLAFAGRVRVVVGGPGWREVVVAERSGWSVTGGPTAYRVRMKPPGEPSRVAFRSDPARAGPVLDGRNVSVVATTEGFEVAVSRNGSTLGRVPMPADNETVSTGGLTFVRRGNSLVALFGTSRIEVAREETYRGRD